MLMCQFIPGVPGSHRYLRRLPDLAPNHAGPRSGPALGLGGNINVIITDITGRTVLSVISFTTADNRISTSTSSTEWTHYLHHLLNLLPLLLLLLPSFLPCVCPGPEVGPPGPEGSSAFPGVHQDLPPAQSPAGSHWGLAGVGGHVPVDWQGCRTK